MKHPKPKFQIASASLKESRADRDVCGGRCHRVDQRDCAPALAADRVAKCAT
jgi:hypothetical protein